MTYIQQVADRLICNPQIEVGPIFENTSIFKKPDTRISAIFIMATDQHSRKDAEERLYACGKTEYGHADAVKTFIEHGDLLLVQNPDNEHVVHSHGQLMLKPGTDHKDRQYQSRPKFEPNGFAKECGFHCKAVAFAPFTKYGDSPEAANQLEIRGWDIDKYAKLQYALYRIGGAMHRILQSRYYHDKFKDVLENDWKIKPDINLSLEKQYWEAADQSLKKIKAVAKILQDVEIKGIENLWLPSLNKLQQVELAEHKAINQYIHQHITKYIPILAQKRNDHLIGILKSEIKNFAKQPSRRIYVLMPEEHAFGSLEHFIEQPNKNTIKSALNIVALKFQKNLKNLGELGVPCILTKISDDLDSSAAVNDVGALDLGVYCSELELENEYV